MRSCSLASLPAPMHAHRLLPVVRRLLPRALIIHLHASHRGHSMTPYRKRNCPITKRLAEDMLIRNFADTTIDAYTYHVRRFADFTGKPLESATVEDVRTFQLYLIQQKKVAYSTFNQAVCALRFYFRHTQPMPWPVTMVPFGKRPKTLPTVLSRQEVDQLIQCTENLKHRTFLTVLYSAGLRYSEAANLTINDIDSKRMLKASKLLLPGVVYYQVVFTLPNALSELALVNRREMADLIAESAWKSLSKNIKKEQGYDPAAVMVLHTWNQKLESHWHGH